MFYVIRYYHKIDGIWQLKHFSYDDLAEAISMIETIEVADKDEFTFVYMKKVG